VTGPRNQAFSAGVMTLKKIARRPRLSFGIAIVCFVVILSKSLPDRLILFPTTAPIAANGALRKALPFENGQLEVWTAASQTAQRKGAADSHILRFYGNADRAERWVAAEAEMWNDRAVEVWGMNYPGFGGSTGPARLSRIGPAALVAFDELKHHANGRPIVLFGASLGSTAALHVAANRPVAGLILHNPPAMREIILRQFGWWNLWLLAGSLASQIPPDLDSITNAKTIRAPAIFLLAERDEVVAPRYHRLVVDAYSGEKRVIILPGAHHNTPVDGAALRDLDQAFEWLLSVATK
jgi:pimeloyl-ACP methyl ester carboxylesterase